MYKTIKIRIYGNEENYKLLMSYERIYAWVLKSLIQKLKQQPHTPFSNLTIPSLIHHKNHWHLYQCALYKSKCATWSTGILSCRWHPSLIEVDKSQLYLPLYNQRISFRLQETLSTAQWHKAKLLRMDIVHDESKWYAIFIYRVQMIE